jgi:hypothetical protein
MGRRRCTLLLALESLELLELLELKGPTTYFSADACCKRASGLAPPAGAAGAVLGSALVVPNSALSGSAR